MQQKGSGAAFWFFCAVIAAGLVILGSSLIGRSSKRSELSTGESTSFTLTITDAKATELVCRYLPSELPIEQASVHFSGGLVTLGGTVTPDAVLTDQVVSAYPELGAVRRLLPQRVSFSVGLTAAVVGGKTEITPKSFSLGEYQIPLGLLPSGIRQALSEAVTEAVGSLGFTLSGIVVGDGSATLYAR